jgi:hypothetical protein
MFCSDFTLIPRGLHPREGRPNLAIRSSLFFPADALADTGRNEEASAICNKLQPVSAAKEQFLPGALVRLGKTNEVIQSYAARPDNPAWVKAAVVCAYAHSGRRADVEEVAVQSSVCCQNSTENSTACGHGRGAVTSC